MKLHARHLAMVWSALLVPVGAAAQPVSPAIKHDHFGYRPGDAKVAQLDTHRMAKLDTELTTDQGIGVQDTDNWLRAGPRGPSLLDARPGPHGITGQNCRCRHGRVLTSSVRADEGLFMMVGLGGVTPASSRPR